MDPAVVHDPVFLELLHRSELASRKLRDAVIAMRSFYLAHKKAPLDESASETWRGAILGEEASARFEAANAAQADLLRYAYELAPHGNSPIHLEEIELLRLAHKKRTERRSGWGTCGPTTKGIEEKARIDPGPPVTLVIRPQHYEFTERAKKAKERAEPAITDPELPPSPESPN